jgi:hypothetical protein
MKIFSIPSKTIKLEDAVAQTLERRFTKEISVIVPECYVDLLPREIGSGLDGNLVLFTKTGKIETLEVGALATELAKRKIKTLGLIDPRCQFKMIVGENLDNVKKEIRLYFQSHQVDSPYEQGELDMDSYVFEGIQKQYFAYTDVTLSHSKKQNELRFESFFKAGGAIVSVQDRYAPITRFVSDKFSEITKETALFCEVSDYEVYIWVAVDCGHGIFSPLIAEFSNKSSSIEFLLDSVTAQTSKQYSFWTPTSAVFLDATKNGRSEDKEIANEGIKKLLAASCGKVVELDKEISRYAGLSGALLMGSGNKKKKEGKDESNAILQIPKVNVTSMQWAHNYLIPITLREFYRKGMGFIAILTFFICSCYAAYWFVEDMRSSYERNIVGLQNSTTRTLRDYAVLKEKSEEFSQLSTWKNNPDVATQYSAVSSFLVSSNCFLVQAVFHSQIQDLSSKVFEDIRPEVERVARTPLAALDVAGVWELSFRLPISGINTNETRKNIVASLQKNAAASFGTSARSMLVLNGGQGQNTMNILRNENSMTAVLLVWRTPTQPARAGRKP